MLAHRLIERKRDGGRVEPGEWRALALAYAAGHVADYQMAAFLMAAFLKGLDRGETSALTDAMLASGSTLDLSHLTAARIDKHSTGGVGDKVSLVLAPLVASLGVVVPMMSGRGLGHTGGTLDKLESIPGFRVELTTEEFLQQVRDVGLAIIGQSANLVPADKLLYGLRDVTATVDNVSLIAASIMSKKIAAGADAIVLDVKVGDGAFMKTIEDARALAEAMLELGRHAGREVACVLTDMDQPLGHAVGNALEIRETVATLRGEGPPDFTELVLSACAHLLAFSDLGIDEATGRERAAAAIQDGSALAAYERWIEAQGGDPNEDALPSAPVVRDVHAPRGGHVGAIGAVDVGLAALRLGAGRRTKDDEIDHAVGVVCLKKCGDAVDTGDVLAQVHAGDDDSAVRAAGEVLASYAFADDAPPARPIVLETIG